jgi:single-strand DNA-binding protein
MATAQIIGRLGQTPELSYTHGGTPVVNLSIASNRQKKNGDGEKVSIADWFRISVFGRDAEIIAEYARKGSALAFNGRLLTDSYTDREGQQRTSTYLIADSFEFVPLPKRADEDAAASEETEPGEKKREAVAPDASADDIPF